MFASTEFGKGTMPTLDAPRDPEWSASWNTLLSEMETNSSLVLDSVLAGTMYGFTTPLTIMPGQKDSVLLPLIVQVGCRMW